MFTDTVKFINSAMFAVYYFTFAAYFNGFVYRLDNGMCMYRGTSITVLTNFAVKIYHLKLPLGSLLFKSKTYNFHKKFIFAHFTYSEIMLK